MQHSWTAWRAETDEETKLLQKGTWAGYCETHSSTCRPGNTWTSLWFCPSLPLLPQYNPLLQRWNGTGWVQVDLGLNLPPNMSWWHQQVQQHNGRGCAEWNSWWWVPTAHTRGRLFLFLGGSSRPRCPCCDWIQSMVRWANQMCYENAPLS